MHIQPYFKMSKQDCFKQISPTAFGQLITVSNNKIVQTYVPFIIDEKNNCLYGHIAKQNKQVESLKSLSSYEELTVTFLGSDAYISPNWYIAKEQVPTWNYEAVEIKGVVELFDNEGTLKVIDQLSQLHEKQFDQPWLIEKLSEKKLNAMLNAIVGFRIDIKEMNGISKMSQNKAVEEQQGVIDGLLELKDLQSHEVAKQMKNNLNQRAKLTD